MMTSPPPKKKSVPRIVPEVPEVLKIIGEESERNGTNILTSRQVDEIITATRAQKKKR